MLGLVPKVVKLWLWPCQTMSLF